MIEVYLPFAAEEDPFERRVCGECQYLKYEVTFCCGNKNAIAYRGTSLPTIADCPF